jgi:DNA mismatch repair ATPase MutL
VGTSFRIQGFLQALPVRKETAKKAAPKTLASIKKLLYSYAYARPSIRFAFKVLKAKNEKANWNYGPKVGSVSLQDATAKIAGQEVAAQCDLRSANLPQIISQSASERVFSLEAVIVRTDAGMSSVLYVSAL